MLCLRQISAQVRASTRSLSSETSGRGFGLASQAQTADRAAADLVRAKEREEMDPEARRRRKRVEEKRRQKVIRSSHRRCGILTCTQGASFVDHMIVTVRGGMRISRGSLVHY